ncbi:unnamed protein product [Mytilus coruscus]|uniref:Uncharacterized protein n=1 Tax=Mytilus coruscus TaxID=42192 RepID=A0A6J8CQY8_MYTCO|nr:unnamed protein product [Mytilus coruscus]
MIECCMWPLNISKGHRPRYNLRKNVIQEIPCEEEYFMPYDYQSNSYHDNGPSHCKIQKGSCMGDGMKMCSIGSTTTDITCYCDHTQNYVPRLLSTSPCFLQFENECMVTSSCNVIIEYNKSQVKRDSNLSNERLLLIIYILSAILAVLLSCIIVYFVRNTLAKKDQTTNVLRSHRIQHIGENQESQYVDMHANLERNNKCIPVTSIGAQNISAGIMFEM